MAGIDYRRLVGHAGSGYERERARRSLNSRTLGDATSIDGMVFYGTDWATQSQSQTAQNALDTWFNTYFFHVEDNQTQAYGPEPGKPGVATDSVWRGVYHM